MDLRSILLAACFALAGLAIAHGAHELHPALGDVVAGVLIAVWAWLVLGETKAK